MTEILDILITYIVTVISRYTAYDGHTVYLLMTVTFKPMHFQTDRKKTLPVLTKKL